MRRFSPVERWYDEALEQINLTTILFVEDDRTLTEGVSYNLHREGYEVVTADNAQDAIRLARTKSPDLVLLDLMLPGGSGFDVCQAIRTFSTVPVIMLTARDEDVDRVLGLELGADDYITKPFGLRELLARIKANLRRVAMHRGDSENEVLRADVLLVDVAGRRVQAGEAPIQLQPKEFDLLVYLMRHPGIVLTRDRLLHEVWGHDFVGPRTVDVHIRRVRAKLESAGLPDPIRTAHGVGYAFDADAAGRPAGDVTWR